MLTKGMLRCYCVITTCQVRDDKRVWLLNFFKEGDNYGPCATCDTFYPTWQKLSGGLSKFMLGRIIVDGSDGIENILKECGVSESDLPVVLMLDSMVPDVSTQSCAGVAHKLMSASGGDASKLMTRDQMW